MAQPDNSNLAAFFLPVIAEFRSLLPQAKAAPELADMLKGQLESACNNAIDSGFSTADTQQSLFAVVAWLDEQAMGYGWDGAVAWRLAPLQRHYFSTTRAGSEFYQRLDALEPGNTAVCEVYALMLIAGFKGEKGSRSEQPANDYMRALIADLRSQSRHSGLESNQPLFPATTLQRDLLGSGHLRRKPLLMTLMLIGVPLLIMLAVYFYLDFSLGQAVDSLIGTK